MGDKEMKNAEKRIQKKYSEEEKNKIIGRMLPPESATLVYAGLGTVAIVGVAFGVSELIAFFGIIGSAAVVVE